MHVRFGRNKYVQIVKQIFAIVKYICGKYICGKEVGSFCDYAGRNKGRKFARPLAVACWGERLTAFLIRATHKNSCTTSVHI